MLQSNSSDIIFQTNCIPPLRYDLVVHLLLDEKLRNFRNETVDPTTLPTCFFDLSTADLCLGGYLKGKVYQSPCIYLPQMVEGRTSSTRMFIANMLIMCVK